MTVEDVAQFLYKEEGLNKVKKGEYLGEKYEFWHLFHIERFLIILQKIYELS